MKYIDAEKLKDLINEKWQELADKNVNVGGGKWDAEISTYLSVLRLIDSLQQEQDILVINKKDWEEQEKFLKNKKFGVPLQQEQPTLPDNLDEAANSYASKTECAVVACRGFKAGAEWMAGQGLISEGLVYQTTKEDTKI